MTLDGFAWVSALWKRGCLGKILTLILSIVFAVTVIAWGAIIVFGLSGGYESTGTEVEPKSNIIRVTPTPMETLEASTYESMTAGDWAKMNRDQRSDATAYWLNFWQQAGNETSLNNDLMNVCITEEVIRTDPVTPQTILILSITDRCVSSKSTANRRWL